MQEILHRESVYLWYYFMIQFRQIFRYWLLGMAIGSAVSVFAKKKIHGIFQSLSGRKLGFLHSFSDSIIIEDIVAQTECTLQEAEELLRDFDKENICSR